MTELLDRAREALEPFARADIDVSGTAAVGVTADDILRAMRVHTELSTLPDAVAGERSMDAVAALSRLQELYDFMAGLSESQFADLASGDEGETFLNRIVGVLGNALP